MPLWYRETLVLVRGAPTIPSLDFGGGGPYAFAGAGTPEGAVAAPVGSYYLRTDGGTETTFYVKEAGTGTAGWRAMPLPGSGTGSTWTTGTATLDFGAFPGAAEAVVTVVGQAAIVAGSTVLAWLYPAATADHSEDEHRADGPRVVADTVVAGVGFTVRGYAPDPVPTPDVQADRRRFNPDRIQTSPMSYGQWNVRWAWV